jgi:hypothetical protein
LAHVLPTLSSAEKSALEVCSTELEQRRARADALLAGTQAGPSRVATADVDEAARLLFDFTQEALRWFRQHGHGAREERFLIELWRLQSLAFNSVAARRPGARRRAKELQLQAGHGEPLTVCVGELTPKPLPDLRDMLDPEGELEEYRIPTIAWNTRGNGCGAICRDSVGLRRPDLRRWCQDCNGSTTARRDAMLTSISKAYAGSPSYLAWADGRRVRVWPRSCSVCGDPFKTDRANRERCDSCLAGHRAARRNGGSAPPSN